MIVVVKLDSAGNNHDATELQEVVPKDAAAAAEDDDLKSKNVRFYKLN